MLGSQCSPCCGCDKCATGKLPDTVTVTIEGKISDFANPRKAGLGKILRVNVKSNFGSGARLKIEEPGGHPPSDDPNACPSDVGPISSDDTTITLVDPPPEGEEPNGTDGVVILNAGSGYARLNRVQPIVTARVTSSAGYEEYGCDDAEVTLTIEEGSDGGLPFWYVSGVSVSNDCYLFGRDVQLAIQYEAGTVVVETPYIRRGAMSNDGEASILYETLLKGYFYKLDTENVITADVEVQIINQPPNEGSGAQIKANIQDDPTKPGFGSILSYTIVSAGDDYLAWYYGDSCDCEPHGYVLPRVGNSCTYSLCICEGDPGPPLVTLAATSCTGSGASGVATEPVGIPGKADGPITKVAGGGGGGYAVLGREEPTVRINGGGSGAGLEGTTTLLSNKGNCDLPTWGVESVSVTKGGCNYLVGDAISFGTDNSFDFSGGSHDETYGSGEVTKTTTAEPTLEVPMAGGLTFTFTTKSNGDTPQTWGIENVSLSGDPAGWTDEQGIGVTTTGACDSTLRNADLRIRTRREEPTVSAAVNSEGGGASLGVSLTKFAGADKRDQWKVTAVTGGGGAGYASGDGITFTVESDRTTEVKSASASVSAVDEDGAITKTTVSSPGAYWRDTGDADEVEVRDGGSYAIVGIVEEIEVTLAGNYYRDNTSAEPIVPPVTVTLSQSSPSNGTGAEFGVVVNTDPQDGAFGSVTKFTIKNGGSGYLAATTLTSDCMSVEYLGPTTPATFTRNGRSCSYTVSADELVQDCSKFSWKHAASQCNGMTVTVEPGGTPTQPDGKLACCGCCCVADPEDSEEQNKVSLDPGKCSDSYGLFIANKTCEAVSCPDAVPCCVPPNIILGTEDVAQCEDDYGGRVLQKNPPPEACNVANLCACAVGLAYDWAQCHGFNSLAAAGAVGGDTNATINGSAIYGTFNGLDIGGSPCGGKYVFLTRKSTLVDFSTHCLPSWFCNGDRLTYAYLNCETGDVEIHDPTDYYNIHDGLSYGQDGSVVPVTTLGASGGACAAVMVPAP